MQVDEGAHADGGVSPAADGGVSPAAGGGAPPAVGAHFDAAAGYWHRVYGGDGLQGLVYRRRMALAARWAAELGPRDGAEALDVGCGAGLMSVELAEAGLRVTATDASAEMARTAAGVARERGLEGRVTVLTAHAGALPFEDGRFGLVVALGLLPWLEDPAAAVGEMVRVLAPDGTLIVTADNRRRLNRLIEPRESPLLAPVRGARRRRREAAGWAPASAQSHRHAAEEVDAMLAAHGINVVRRATVGYGPFTVLGRGALPDRAGRLLDTALATASERHVRLRGAGWHYVVAGVKGSRPPAGAARGSH
jgi:ubiquinone/menaquinone biosynthesis C-methylase UbiE